MSYVLKPGILPVMLLFLSFSAIFVESNTQVLPSFINDTIEQGPGVLGVSIKNITSSARDLLGLKSTGGVIVTDVTPFSPAYRAGIQAGTNLTSSETNRTILWGDVILALNGIPVNHTNDVVRVVEERVPGEMVNVTYSRNGKAHSESIVLSREDEIPDFVHSVSGKYANPRAGVVINLPNGWSGFEIEDPTDFVIVGPHQPDISDIGKGNISMAISIIDLLTLQNMTETNSTLNQATDLFEEESKNAQCKTISESLNQLNGTIVLSGVNECGISGAYSKTNTSILATERNLITISFRASSNDLYNDNLAKYDESLTSLRILNPVDIRTVFTDLSIRNQTAGLKSDINASTSVG